MVLLLLVAVLSVLVLALILWFLIDRATRATTQAAAQAAQIAQIESEAQRDQAVEAAVTAAIGQLTVTNEAQVANTVERAIAVASDTFATHLEGGQREMAVRSETFDQKINGIVDTLDKKLSAVDQVVGQKVDGMGATVGESVGGMSKLMGEQVGNMKGEMAALRKLVGSLQNERAEQHGLLVERLESTARDQQALVETTGQLRSALASPKSRGQWGERMADDVLRAAGFIEGINYRKQAKLDGGTTPDFTFLLPSDQLLHMDVKFPIDNYLRFLEADTDDDRSLSAKTFVRDVRARIKELHPRDYQNSDSTVGYVLLFIPNESVYGFIHEHDGALLDYALSQSVVLCSPTTLFAVLGVIRQAIDSFMVEKTSTEILQVLGSFSDEWTKFSAALDKVGKQLATMNKSFDELSGTRRRVLEKKLDKVDQVRAQAGIDDVLDLEAQNMLAEPQTADILTAMPATNGLRDVTSEQMGFGDAEFETLELDAAADDEPSFRDVG